ncbi:hypothetical protein C0Q70_08445 [Pomacea canaliculata]|uniref:Uncharacterized protein n=1 Tax=Pomacea canaliculata TaxID=400727 RepID=A0A2T7PHW3_POMCA|nr:uncharacterized protein LOC112562683 isoform X2 [Pomacea canaliculata]PVD32997.1 hypothetical protein C0Q70_08445 [Pomacea canaliculata]
MATRAIVTVILIVCFVAIIDGQQGGRRNQGNDVTTDASVGQGRGQGRGRGREPGERRWDRHGRGPEVPGNQTEGNETTTQKPVRGRDRFQWRDGRRNRPFQLFADVSTWNRTFNGSEYVEKGFAIDNRSIVEVFTGDPNLNDQTPFTPSITLYDFSNETQVVAIKPMRLLYLCIIVDPEALPPLTFQEAADIVNSRNDTVVGDLAGPVVLNITEGLIEGAERGALFRNNSMLRRFCGRRRIVHAVLSTSGEPSDSPSVYFITLDTGVKVQLPPRRRRMRHPDEETTTSTIMHPDEETTTSTIMADLNITTTANNTQG